MTLNYSFSGKRVLVTGGGGGIGLQTAKSFYNDGATVFVIDRDPALLELVKSEMPKAQTFCIDLLDWEKTRETVESLAPLDHVVNNAGIVIFKYCIDFTPEDFDKIFGINVKAIVNVSNAFVKGIIDKKHTSGGTIVNISSVSDRIVTPGMTLYSATKAAVTMLTKSMAAEFYVHNVRVNCVCPGMVPTTLASPLTSGSDYTKQFGKQFDEQILAPRDIMQKIPITTQDIANHVLFLSSPLAAKCTGGSYLVDGGFTLS